MFRNASSLASMLTPRGRGAVATIAFQGDLAALDAKGLFRAASGRSLIATPLNRIVFGRWGPEPAEEVVVCRVAYDRVEIHCHGGDAAVARVASLLAELKFPTVSWQEFLERTEGGFASDVIQSLAAAATARTAALISRQIEGPLPALFRWLSEADPIGSRTSILDRLNKAVGWSEFGRHLTQPWRVVLFGAPNVGKSSLINALAGFERSIVFDRPGTTRDVVTIETAFEGWPVRLADTAGFRAGSDDIETAGIERAKAELAAADLIVGVCDQSDPTSADAFAFSPRPPSLVIVNKSDLPQAMRVRVPEVARRVSARTGDGIKDLMVEIIKHLVPRLPEEDEAVPITERQIEAIHSARAALIAGEIANYRRHVGSVGSMT